MLDNATGTVTDTTSVGAETAGAAPQEDMDNIIDNFTLDDLLQYGAEDDPLFADDAQHKGMKPLNQWIHNVPEDVRKHLANIRADYTRKTQALSAAKREVEQAKEQMYRRPYDLPKVQITERNWYQHELVKEHLGEKTFDQKIMSYRPDCFELVGYQSHPKIKAPLSN